MGELEEEYGDRVDFVLVPAEETMQRSDEIEEFGFTEQKHGLVAFTREGTPLVKLPGHQYGKDEVQAATEAVLAN